MKRIIIFVLLFAALKVAGQTTGYLRFDTVKIMKQNGTCELYVINKTKDSLGLLTNIGGGLTQFRRSKMLNDSTIIIGLDTIIIHSPSGSGQNLSNTSLTANGDYLHNWAQHPLRIDSIADTLRLSMFKPSSSYPNNKFRFNLNAHNSTVTPFALEWGLTDIFDTPDSAYAGLTSSSLGTTINQWSNYGARFSTIELNGGFNQPYISIEANNSGSKSRIYMDKSVYIMGDSVGIKAVPAASADSGLGIRKTRLFNGMEVSTVVKYPVSSATLDTTTIYQNLALKLNKTDTTNKWINDIRRSNDSVYVFKNGSWQFKYKDSTGGGSSVTAGIQTSITNNAINYDPRVNSCLIFNDFLTNSIGSNWDASNAPNTTITFASGHMRLAGGSSTDYIYDSLTTMVHRWTEEIGGVIRSVASSDTFGFGISVLGAQKILVKVKASNLSSIMVYRTGSTITTMGTTSSQGTVAIGDSVVYKLRRDNFNMYVDIINKTQSTSQTLTYPFSNIDAVSGTVIPFRELSITINNLSGTFDVDYAKLYNQERLYPDWAFVGMSITDGFNAIAPDSTFYNRLQNYFPDKRFAQYALSGSQAAHFTTGGSRQNDLLAMRAKRAIVMFGINEIQASISTQAFVSSVRALVDTLENHGTQVMVCNTTPYNASNKAAIIAYNSALLSEFGNQVINIYDTLEINGLMQSSNDSLHPDAQGHRYLFNVFKDEITRLANVPYDPEGVIRIFPRGVEAGARLGAQSNFGLIPLNLGTSGTNYPSIGYNIKYSPTSGVHNYKASDVSTKIEMGSNAGANIGFYTAPSGTAGDPITFTQQMAVTPTGIGIGSTNAVSYLHIKKNGNSLSTLGNSRWITLDDVGGANNKLMEIGMSYLNGNTYNATVIGVERVGNSGYTLNNFYIANREDDSGDNPPIIRLLIRPNGRIGINTTTPSFGLDVQRSMGANKDSITIVPSIGSNSILLQDTTTGKFQRINSSAFASTSRTDTVFKTDANNSGTSWTQLHHYLVKSNELNNDNESLTWDLSGTFNDATATVNLQFDFDGQLSGQTGALTLLNTGSWVAKLIIIRTSSSTARVQLNVNHHCATVGGTEVETDLTGLNFANPLTLEVLGQAGGGGGGSNDITAKMGKIRWEAAQQ